MSSRRCATSSPTVTPRRCSRCSRRNRHAADDLARLPLRDLLGFAELVDHEIVRPLFDDRLELWVFVSAHDHEAVGLGVNVVVLGDRQADEAAASRPATLAEYLDGPV